MILSNKMEKKVNNYHLETILWLNEQIDIINTKATLIGDLLMEEDDLDVVEKYDAKLMELEQELEVIGQKLELEKKMLTSRL